MKAALISILFLIPSHLQENENLWITFQGELIESIHKQDLTTPFFEPIIEDRTYEKIQSHLKKKIVKLPENAKLNEFNQIVPGKNGYIMDEIEFRERLYKSYYKNDSQTIEIPTRPLYPRVDSEVLESIKDHLIGRYITYFNSGNKERSHNIQLAADAIDNYVVFPGETFSFNQVVGKRTLERGYLPAPVIVKGELTEGIGGGICQVSSTLFNAVDMAGAKILERYSHSKRVPYVPPGRDATVSWYGPDFTFQNPYHKPILIRAKVRFGSMIVQIYSSLDIHEKPRHVPRAPDELPKEITIGTSPFIY
jgi:vancomycin resistance protein YoaR